MRISNPYLLKYHNPLTDVTRKNRIEQLLGWIAKGKGRCWQSEK